MSAAEKGEAPFVALVSRVVEGGVNEQWDDRDEQEGDVDGRDGRTAVTVAVRGVGETHSESRTAPGQHLR